MQSLPVEQMNNTSLHGDKMQSEIRFVTNIPVDVPDYCSRGFFSKFQTNERKYFISACVCFLCVYKLYISEKKRRILEHMIKLRDW